ncbi:MAG: serine hydrolase [Blastocatellia bacterium]|nr:serine hydrolase [Blastocatellia bacterium]
MNHRVSFNRFLSILVLLGLVFVPSRLNGQHASGSSPEQALKGFDEIVNELLRELPVVPGLAVGVVKGDEVILARGYGYRDVEKKLPVTPRTSFYIASVTKSFLGTAAKLLAEGGKLDLDAPISTYLPDLKLTAPLTAEHISVRDLLVHRAGIRNDVIVYNTAYTGNFSHQGVLQQLALSTPVPRKFQYTNLGYIVTAYVLEKVAGDTWQGVVKTNVLDPLQMDSTGFSMEKAMEGEAAYPYAAKEGGFERLHVKRDNVMHAAGGMRANLDDLLKWLIVNMNSGSFQGRQIFSRRALQEILSPQVNLSGGFYGFKRHAYGLGWYLGTYGEETLIHCFGSYTGYRAHISFMPERQIGVVVLANEGRDGVFLPDIVARYIYDRLLGVKDLQERWQKEKQEYRNLVQRLRADREPAESPSSTSAQRTSEPFVYPGVYENSEYGRIEIRAESDLLIAHFGNLQAPLISRGGDSFTADFVPGSFVAVSSLAFSRSASGEAQRLIIKIGNDDVIFSRVRK